jgi:hypothetical protein
MSGDVKILLVFTHLYRPRSLVCRPRDFKKKCGARSTRCQLEKRTHRDRVLVVVLAKKMLRFVCTVVLLTHLENSRGTANGGNSLKRGETKMSNTVCSFCALYI